LINFLFKLFLATVYYIFICLALFLFSSISLINGNIYKNKLINEYQKLFYFNGYRNIWQYDKKCCELDENLIYRPKNGKCKFKNSEFDTVLNFENSMRIHASSYNPNLAPILILGDSHGMGWGVNDNETFASIIQDKLNIKVYNQSVSSYGTFRELKKLQLSNLSSDVNTIIIQYSDNDRNENIDLIRDHNKIKEKNFSFDVEPKKLNLEVFFKFFKRSLKIPFQIFFKKNEKSFDEHFIPLKNVLDHFYQLLKNKKVIIFYSNSHGLKFHDFELYNSKLNIDNIYLIDLNINEKLYYKVDDHLTSKGHKYVAEKLIQIINQK